MPTKGVRVLLVDDNRDAMEAMAMLLESEGYRVQTAHDGPLALESVELSLPDVVLLDIGLPGMSGLDVARALRRLPLARQPLLIALSGYGSERDLQLSRSAGFDHHVVKPAEPDHLFALLAGHSAQQRA